MAFSLSSRGRPCPSSPLVQVKGHILGNTHARHVILDLLVVFLGRPRRLVPGMARFIILRVTLSASRLWTCPNQRRRPQRITSSIGETSTVTCRMRRISSFRIHGVSSRHSEDPAKHPHLRGSNLSLVGHLHCPAFAPIRQSRLIMTSYTFSLSSDNNKR